MRLHTGRIVAVFIYLLASGGLAYPIERELVTHEKDLEDVKQRIRENKKTVKDITKKETLILDEIERINKTLSEKRRELRKIKTTLKKVERDIGSTNTAIQRLEKKREELLHRLTKRLRAMYKMRKGGVLKVVFSVDPSGDIGRRHKYLTMIMEYDTSLMDEYEANISGLKEQRQRLKELKKKMERTRRAVEAKRNETEALKRKKVTILKRIRNEKARYSRLLEELESAARRLTSLVDKLREESMETGGGFASMKGRLDMPVKGKIISFYGKVRHPKFKTVTFNNGIVIEAPFGSVVKSVYDGKVAYTGWLKGYGQVMIIDHGSGFYTLFAHLHRILKEKGDRVTKGEVVGLVGDSGIQGSSGLYFEIRQKGIPRNPLSWFARR